MKRIYFKDQQGNIVFADVTDEVAEQLKENRREQWRGDAYEEYHTTSLDAITDSGHEFEDVNADIESRLIAEEEEAERRFLMRKLRMVMHSMRESLLLRADMNMANCMNHAMKIRLFCFMRFGGDTMLL